MDNRDLVSVCLFVFCIHFLKTTPPLVVGARLLQELKLVLEPIAHSTPKQPTPPPPRNTDIPPETRRHRPRILRRAPVHPYSRPQTSTPVRPRSRLHPCASDTVRRALHFEASVVVAPSLDIPPEEPVAWIIID